MLETEIKKLTAALEANTAALLGEKVAAKSEAPPAAKKPKTTEPEPAPEPIEAPTLETEEVRKELSAIARAGKKEKLIDIFKEHGADKFAGLDPEHYEAVLEKARAL